MPPDPTPPHTTLGVDAALGATRQLHRATWRDVWPLSLAAASVGAALDVYVEQRAGSLHDDVAQWVQLYSAPDVMALSLLQTVLSLAFCGGLIALQYDAMAGRTVRSVPAAFAAGFGRLGHAALICVLWCGIVFAGLLLLVVPGIYWSGSLSLWPVPLFAEDAQGVESLTRSRDAIKGHWWCASTVMTLAGLAVLLVVWAASLVTDALATMLHLGDTTALIVDELLAAAATIWVLPFGTASLVVLYVLLRKERR